MKKGFSLIEIMIVIIILGLLAGLVLPKIMGQGDKAKKGIVCVQMHALKDSLKNFYLDNGTYPTTEEGIQALLTNPNTSKYKGYPEGGYVEHTPQDPWKNPYIYLNNNNTVDFISLGADGAEGGSGVDADIQLSKECRR